MRSFPNLQMKFWDYISLRYELDGYTAISFVCFKFSQQNFQGYEKVCATYMSFSLIQNFKEAPMRTN